MGAGVSAGRKMLAENVEKRKSTAIEEASALARQKLDREVQTIVRTNLQQLLTNALFKFIIIAVIFITYELGWITAGHFAIAAGIMLGLFLIRDIIRLWPSATVIISHLREHGWRPKEAISHYVSATVFDQALNEIAEETNKPKTKFWLQVAGTSHQEVTLEIATAVASIAHETGYEQIRPRIIIAGVRAVTILALYSGIVFTIFQLV